MHASVRVCVCVCVCVQFWRRPYGTQRSRADMLKSWRPVTARVVHGASAGREDTVVGNPRRAQFSQYELSEFIFVLK